MAGALWGSSLLFLKEGAMAVATFLRRAVLCCAKFVVEVLISGFAEASADSM